MRYLLALFTLLSALNIAAACSVWHPLNYCIQENPIIIEGRVEKIDADIPEGDYHYNLVHIRVADVQKNSSDTLIQVGGTLTFRAASRKDPGTSATVYYEEGWDGIWFFNFYPEPEKPLWVAARYFSDKKDAITQELNLPYQRKYEGDWLRLADFRIHPYTKEASNTFPLSDFALHVYYLVKNSSDGRDMQFEVQYPSDLMDSPIRLPEGIDSNLDDYLQKTCQENYIDFEYVEDGIRLFSPQAH